ncbi:hypothetical protein MVES_001137 [Malassezia vespertilionis]|uniref:Bicarbonate transporter-like transmembrane domain-containing protein n=1 Tax=Malassezia vespertilionis TaxID=2020962 RepID=A0A2N1JEV6_9BASI|nr:hypothetical protein MVES_001137 [Malassezia vespertilionis]
MYAAKRRAPADTDTSRASSISVHTHAFDTHRRVSNAQTEACTSNERKKHAKPFASDTPWPERSWLYELFPFRGMWNDVRRRLPYYLSDWYDGLRPANLTIMTISVVQIFFINLIPAIAYVLDMYDRTDGSYGVNEVILASALACFVFSVFSCQPLTFVGVTGLTNLMNYTVYDIAHKHYGLDRMDYLRLQCWMAIWAAGFHFLIAAFNMCDYTRFITDMTSTTFGLYVGVIYVEKGVELLVREFSPAPLDNATGWFSVSIAILFCVTVYYATLLEASSYLPFSVRHVIGKLAFAAGCIFWTGFSQIPGHTLKEVPVSRLPITRSFFPTLNRAWVVDFWESDVRWVFVGAPLGFLLTLLFYFDHNVSSVMAQARKYPITKPAGFHWDFFLLGITTLVSGILGLPMPNGLVPQAPFNTDSLTEYNQADAADTDAIGSRYIPAPWTNASMLHTTYFPQLIITRTVQQRLSHFVIFLLTIGAMTRPILVALGTMPRAVFAGVFLLVGWGSIESNPIVLRTLLLLQDPRAVRIPEKDRPAHMQIPRKRILCFVAIQWVFFGLTIAISQTIAAIGFPVLIIFMIPCRVYLIPKLFTQEELDVLDARTADAPAVMASLGPDAPPHDPTDRTCATKGRNMKPATTTYTPPDLTRNWPTPLADNGDARHGSRLVETFDTDSQEGDALPSADAPRPKHPWMIQWKDNFLLTFTLGNRIEIWSSRNAENFKHCEKTLIWRPDGSGWAPGIWAPELHNLNGVWYVYFSGEKPGQGAASHRTLVLRSRSQDPLDAKAWEFMGPLHGVPDHWAIDATVFCLGQDMYCCYSGWPVGDNSDTEQDLFLVKLSDPLHAISDTLTVISRPTLPWERPDGGKRGVNEGPTFVKLNGFVGIVYSAHGSWTYEYKLGLLALVGNNPLDPNAWKKRNDPLLSCDPKRGGPYGPGHASFIPSTDGNQTLCIFHCTGKINDGWGNRKAHVMQLPASEFTLDAQTQCCSSGRKGGFVGKMINRIRSL